VKEFIFEVLCYILFFPAFHILLFKNFKEFMFYALYCKTPLLYFLWPSLKFIICLKVYKRPLNLCSQFISLLLIEAHLGLQCPMVFTWEISCYLDHLFKIPGYFEDLILSSNSLINLSYVTKREPSLVDWVRQSS